MNEWLAKFANGDKIVIEASSSDVAYLVAVGMAHTRHTALVGDVLGIEEDKHA